MNHKLTLERHQDTMDKVLKKDTVFSIDCQIWGINELEAQKIHRMISDIIDGEVRE